MRDWYDKGKPIVQVIEDPYTGALRPKRPDAQRTYEALTKPYHELYEDKTLAFMVEHMNTIVLFALNVLDTPMDVPEIYGIPGGDMVDILRNGNQMLRELLNMLRPPRTLPPRRDTHIPTRCR